MIFAKEIINGDIRSAARLIRDIEDEIPTAREDLKNIYPHTGRAYILGITGSPGTGKSTLVDKLVKAFREQEKTVGVIAVDPTSPFTGGAILGDRIRMQGHIAPMKESLSAAWPQGGIWVVFQGPPMTLWMSSMPWERML